MGRKAGVITTRVLELEPSRALAPVNAVPRIGLVLLSTDATTEPDFTRLLGQDEVLVASNRITFENPTTRESLLRTGPLLEAAAADLLPGSAFAAIYFSCTDPVTQRPYKFPTTTPSYRLAPWGREPQCLPARQSTHPRGAHG